jgi:hypothetical protein
MKKEERNKQRRKEESEGRKGNRKKNKIMKEREGEGRKEGGRMMWQGTRFFRIGD